MTRVFWVVVFMILALPAAAREYVVSSALSSACAKAAVYESVDGVTIENDNSFGIADQPIRIPLTVELVEAFGLIAPQGTGLEPSFGEIEARPDGRVFYNDQDISSRINEVCNIDE
jgi:hypothetical protein